MRNHQTLTLTNASEALVSPSGFNNLPPIKLWVDSLLDDLFSDNTDLSCEVLTPFDYEGFLKKEGLLCKATQML